MKVSRFKLLVKDTLYGEVVVEAKTAKEARRLFEEEGQGADQVKVDDSIGGRLWEVTGVSVEGD